MAAIGKKCTVLAGIGILSGGWPAVAAAQVIVREMPGYVVTAQGDTLRGLLTIPRFVTDKGLVLRPTAQGPAQQLGVQQLRVVGLQDGRRLVKLKMAVRRDATTGVVDSAAVLLQQLVGGYASFYRYDVNLGHLRSEAGYTQSETVQYFIQVAGGSLAQVRGTTQQATLTAVFRDCPAVVAAVPRTIFEEYKLSSLVLRYNTECHASVPAHDYRLPETASTVQVLVSARLGLQRGQLYYPSSYYLPQSEAQAATLPTYGLELRLASASHWSLIAGVDYARLRSTATLVEPAQQGTTNAGQLLSLPISAEAQSLQGSLLVRYTLGHGPLRPYVVAGPRFGMYITTDATLSYTTLTYVGGYPIYYRNDVVTKPVAEPRSTSPTTGGLIRLGVQLHTKTRLSPLLEAQFSAGSDNGHNPGLKVAGGIEDLGQLHYQTFSLLAGLEF